MTNLYILAYPKLSAFKVGKANDVFARTETLNKFWGKPDYNSSYYIEVEDNLVYKLEKGLHYLLSAFNKKYDEGDGKTEFFDVKAFDDAINYLKIFVQSNNIKTEIIKGVEVPDSKLLVSTQKKVDYYSIKHNARARELTESLDSTFKNLRYVLRANTLLIKYRKSIKFELVNDKDCYILTIYRRKHLAKIIFDHLRASFDSFTDGSSFINFGSSVARGNDSYILKFYLSSPLGSNKLYDLVINELAASYKLVMKANS